MSQKCPSCDYPYVPNGSSVTCPNCGQLIEEPSCLTLILGCIVVIIFFGVAIGTCSALTNSSNNNTTTINSSQNTQNQLSAYETDLWNRWMKSRNGKNFTKEEQKTIWGISVWKDQQNKK